jgi:urease accessory protein
MPGLIIIQHLPHVHGAAGREIKLRADRATLAKRRWRGIADDGREFGFDLPAPLAHGAAFFVHDDIRYIAHQRPETVLEIPVAGRDEAAHLAWNLGNLHFGIEILPHAIRAPDDPAILQFLARENIAFERISAVFLPLSAGASHHHHHADGHAH